MKVSIPFLFLLNLKSNKKLINVDCFTQDWVIYFGSLVYIITQVFYTLVKSLLFALANLFT